MSLQIPKVIPHDWNRLRVIVDKLKHLRLGNDSSPTFTGLTLSGLAASRLAATDSGKVLESSDLVSWVTQTANQVLVADDGDGTITLSTPQDIHVDATPEFAGIVIKDSGDNVIFYADNDEMYFTASTIIEIADGMSIGLLLALTYKI